MELETSNQTVDKKSGAGPAVFLAGCMLLLAIFAAICLAGSTSEFWAYGVLLSLLITCPLAVIVLPVAAVLGFATAQLHKRGYVPRWINRKSITACGLGFIVFGLGAGIYQSLPAVRFKQFVPRGDYQVSDVEVTGFDSFLARRWLVSFRVPEAQVAGIAADLGLEECTDVDLRTSLRKDPHFAAKAPVVIERAPGAGEARAFKRVDHPGQAVEWMTLVYSAAAGRAWLFSGYQN